MLKLKLEYAFSCFYRSKNHNIKQNLKKIEENNLSETDGILIILWIWIIKKYKNKRKVLTNKTILK